MDASREAKSGQNQIKLDIFGLEGTEVRCKLTKQVQNKVEGIIKLKATQELKLPKEHTIKKDGAILFKGRILGLDHLDPVKF